jgi:hypothetical protein
MTTHRDSPPCTTIVSTMGYLTMIVALAPCSIAAFSGRLSPVSSRSRAAKWHLEYTSGADHENTIQRTTSSHTSGWWNSIFAREESSPADDYLEFLEKRYSRILHDDNEEQPGSSSSSSKKSFNVLQWLYQGEEAEANQPKHREDDALYVLGVANLASKRLLQKHHLLNHVKEEVESSEISFNKESAIDAEIVVTPTSEAIVGKPVVKLWHQMVLSRQRMIQRQTRSIRFATNFLLSKMLLTGSACQKLFQMGGGKLTWTVTLAAVAAALSLALNPLFRVISAHAANNLRP